MDRADEKALPALAAAWSRAQHVVVLTGAGLSTASGIPDFRSPGGLWEQFRAVTIQEFLADARSRSGYWQYKQATWELVCQAEPNAAHRALTELARAGRIDLLVTQNVDGLHARAGFPPDRLVQIHGTATEAVCLSCGRRQPRDTVQAIWNETGEPPRCSCGGWWKPATISFGQSLVVDDLERSMEAARRCDLLVAVGSSLVVGPINGMVSLAHAHGATVTILTASNTPFDDLAAFVLHAPVQEVLPHIAETVLAVRRG